MGTAPMTGAMRMAPASPSEPRSVSRRLWLDLDEVGEAPRAERLRTEAPEAERLRTEAPEPRARGRRRAPRLMAIVALGLAGIALASAALGELPERLRGGDPEPRQGAGSATGQVHGSAAAGVVAIRVDRDGATATGSGFIVDDDGTLVTNAHVVGDSTSASIQVSDEGAFHSAEVLGTDPSSDLAVLRFDPDEVGGVDALELADSDEVAVGDRVVAIGHPLGLETTTTTGVVTGLDREIQAPNGFTIAGAIQTDARLLPGNSGGPLLDGEGRVVGVASQVAVPPSGFEAQIGFAVASNSVAEVLPSLANGRTVEHAYLGVSMGASAVGGVEIESVTSGGPAEDAGVRAGDVVTAIDGETVGAADDLSAAIGEREPGERVELAIERDGESIVLDVALDVQPSAAPSLSP